MSEQYLVLGEVGFTDGPFTEDDLRYLLGNGRVRSQDRIRRVRDGEYFDLSEIIPDAADISAVRPVASDRIRRKTSDRKKAAQEKSDRVPILVPVEDPVGTVPVDTPAAPSDPGSTPPNSPPAGSAPRTWRQSPLVGVVALMTLVGCGWWLFGDGGTMSRSDIQGTWDSQPVGPGAGRRNAPQLQVVIDPLTVVFEMHHQRHITAYEVELSLADVLVLNLTKPHPTFGAKVAFARGQQNLVLLHGDQGIPLVRK